MQKFLFTAKTERIPRNNTEFSNNNIFQIGGGKILEKDFDLRNYLEKAQEKMKKERGIKQKTGTRFSNFSNCSYLKNRKKELSPIVTNFGNFSITNSFNKNSMDKSNYPPYLNTNYNTNNISTKYSNNAFTANKISINSSNMDTFFNMSKSTNKSKPNKKLKSLYLTNRFNNTSNSKSNEYFNVYKAVKQIKLTSKDKNKIIDLEESANKSNTDRLKPIVAFNRDYLDVVFESNNLINNYYNRKKIQLDKPESTNKFMNQNEEIAVKNLMLKLINTESEKLNNLTDRSSRKIEKNRSTLENDEKDFEIFSNLQKTTCKNLENILIKLQEENRKLLDEERINRGYNKLYQDEIIKTLCQIEDVRTYAIFVNEVLGGDVSKFEHEIIPNYSFKNKKCEQIAQDVIENYGFYLSDNYNKEEEFLSEPDYLCNKYNEIELGIIRLLKEKEEIILATNKFKEENKNVLDELNLRYNDLLSEYKIHKNNLENELQILNGINQRENKINENKEYENYIEEIYSCIQNIFTKRSLNAHKPKKKERYDTDYYLQESHKILNEKEDFLNKLLKQINSYVDNDTDFFYHVIDIIKREEKEIKFLEFKKKHSQGIQPLKVEKRKKADKIMFITGKYEPNVHKDNKKEKNPIDSKLIKRMENEELLTYK